MERAQIERRFLVSECTAIPRDGASVIVQGYLFAKDGYCVRVRRTYLQSGNGNVGECDPLLTAKSPRRHGQRPRYEMTIPVEIASMLLAACSRVVIKTRIDVLGFNHPWSVDVFHFKGDRLMIAECTVPVDDIEIEIPSWCGREITHDPGFDNEQLAIERQHSSVE